MIKTGDQHAASSRDGRTAYLDGALVDDVTSHSAYRNAVRSICGLHDFQSEDRLTAVGLHYFTNGAIFSMC